MMLDSSFGCALYIHTGAYSPFFRGSYLLLDDMTIFIHGYRDVWLILTDSLLYIRYPRWGIFPLPLRFLSVIVYGTRMDDHC